MSLHGSGRGLQYSAWLQRYLCPAGGAFRGRRREKGRGQVQGEGEMQSESECEPEAFSTVQRWNTLLQAGGKNSQHPQTSLCLWFVSLLSCIHSLSSSLCPPLYSTARFFICFTMYITFISLLPSIRLSLFLPFHPFLLPHFMSAPHLTP